MIFGRSLFALVTERQVHDVYSFTVGVYVISGIWYLQEWFLATHQSFTVNGLQAVDIGAILKKVLSFGKLLAKLVYFGVVFGIVFPLTLGLMMEIGVILPMRTILFRSDASIIPVFVSVRDNWLLLVQAMHSNWTDELSPFLFLRKYNRAGQPD